MRIHEYGWIHPRSRFHCACGHVLSLHIVKLGGRCFRCADCPEFDECGSDHADMGEELEKADVSA